MRIPKMFIPETKLDEKLEDLLKKYSEKKKMAKLKEPEIGMRVYAPDFVGGFCKIVKIKETIRGDGKEIVFVELEERPDLWCSWDYIQENQARWEKEYNNRMKSKTTIPEFNC